MEDHYYEVEIAIGTSVTISLTWRVPETQFLTSPLVTDEYGDKLEMSAIIALIEHYLSRQKEDIYKSVQITIEGDNNIKATGYLMTGSLDSSILIEAELQRAFCELKHDFIKKAFYLFGYWLKKAEAELEANEEKVDE